MTKALYFYSPLSLKELQAVVEAHQDEFDLFLEDTFSDDELLQYERMLDSIAAVWPQPILTELNFEDFYADPLIEEGQRSFFESCRSSLLLENVPDFESNPFQVTYLIQLLSNLGEVLVDKGGTQELSFKAPFLEELKKYKNVDAFISSTMEKVVGPELGRPVTPIDYILHDIYKELDRLGEKEVEIEAEKARKIYLVMKAGKTDAFTLLKKSGLNPKDFDDNLEKLKFLLKKQ